MDKKYYFIIYECDRCSQRISNDSHYNGVISNSKFKTQDIIDIHPIQYQLNFNKKYGDYKENGHGYLEKETCFLLNWKEITKEEYDNYKGYI